MIPALVHGAIRAAESGFVPDALLRAGIRSLCERHARALGRRDAAAADRDLAEFVAGMRRQPIALVPDAANRQHYELPPELFAQLLGPHRKYSCCLWEAGTTGLEAAEAAALEETVRHADLRDGQRVLELGCGWGSLTLWMARRHPGSRITAISNSAPQRAWVMAEAARRGLGNVDVRTVDANDLVPEGPFDRVVSVEMFEHLRNWEEMLRRVARALAPDGRVFLHVFCHRAAAYAFTTDRPEDWMGRRFFTGGMMPCRDLLHRLELLFDVEEEWIWSGEHYRRTAEAWLERLDGRGDAVRRILSALVGEGEAPREVQRWRMFFMACAELFGLRGGTEWMVLHARLRPAPDEARRSAGGA